MIAIIINPIIRRVCMVHIAFHTFWVILFITSLFGVFLIVPLIGLYNAFVLGFLGNATLDNSFRAALLGYFVFTATGLLSGWFISIFQFKSTWFPAFISIIVTVILLMTASFVRHIIVGVKETASILPIPATTGRADIDQLSMALKLEYEMVSPPSPPYLQKKGILVSFSEMRPLLRILPDNFNLQGGPYIYCNLSASVWKSLKINQGMHRYPIMWSSQPDNGDKRLVILIDLDTDEFNDQLVSKEEFSNMFSKLELAIRQQIRDADLTIPK